MVYNFDVYVVCFQLGEILFMNLLTQKLITKSDVDSTVRTIELFQDDQQTTTHLLVSTVCPRNTLVKLLNCLFV